MEGTGEGRVTLDKGTQDTRDRRTRVEWQQEETTGRGRRVGSLYSHSKGRIGSETGTTEVDEDTNVVIEGTKLRGLRYRNWTWKEDSRFMDGL